MSESRLQVEFGDAYTPGKYEQRGADLGALVDRKNAAYGNSFQESGAVMRILYKKGIAPDQLDDALVVVRILDKLFRISNDPGAFGENPWMDIAGYSLLMAGPLTEKQGGTNAHK